MKIYSVYLLDLFKTGIFFGGKNRKISISECHKLYLLFSVLIPLKFFVVLFSFIFLPVSVLKIFFISIYMYKRFFFEIYHIFFNVTNKKRKNDKNDFFYRSKISLSFFFFSFHTNYSEYKFQKNKKKIFFLCFSYISSL